MKKWGILFLVSMVMMSGCQQQQSTTADFGKVFYIIQQETYRDNIDILGLASLQATTGIEPDNIEDFLFAKSVDSSYPELYLFVKTKPDMQTMVEEKVQNYFTNLETDNTSPLAELVKSKYEYKSGAYLVYILKSDTSGIEDIIKSYIK